MRALPRQGTVQFAAVVVTILGMAVWAPWTAAAESQRGMKWQFTFPVTFVSGASVDGQEGTRLEINDDVSWGLGFGYNLNEHFLVGADVTWISANYKATIATDLNNDQVPDGTASLSGTLDASTLNFYGQYNILKHSFTPFIRAGLGWTWIDSNIPSGPATGTCWWHPYYGYICDTWQPTYGSTRFSYGAAAGLRADIRDKFLVEASYNVLWIDYSSADTSSIDGFRLNLGWKF